MAVGDITVFDEAKAKMIKGNWASTDLFYCAVIGPTVTPTASFATPTWSDFSANEVTAAGTYTANGTSLGDLDTLVQEVSGTMTFDSTVNPNWGSDPANATNATWGIVYNFTDVAQDCLCFIELGTVDMQAGDLTIAWSASGLYTIT